MSKLRERFKKIRKKIDAQDFEEDDQGRVMVNINISDVDSLMSVYDSDGREMLSEDTAKFIDNVVKGVSPKKDLHLFVSCERYTADKEDDYRAAIVNYYTNEFAEKDRQYKRNWILSAILILASIAGFVLMGLIGSLEVGSVIYDLFEIAVWVLAWEAVDILAFRQVELRFSLVRDVQIIYSTITFSSYVED